MPDRTKARALVDQYFAANDPTGWFEALYALAGNDPASIPWADLAPNPNLLAWLDRHHVRGDGRTALTIGCGLGDDAEELARRGFTVTAFDISPTAVAWCKRRFANSHVQYVTADLLAPPSQWKAAFDFVLESYTVQALPLDLRERAIAQVASFLAAGAELLVICRGRDDRDPPGEIPWPLSVSELRMFTDHGLAMEALEDYLDEAETPPVRRFRAHFKRTQ
jgi:SAM-dependent methyltransferase